MKLQLALILTVSLILVLFTFQNPHPVPMQFMAWHTNSFPVIGLILVSVLGGIVASAVLGLRANLKLQRTLRKMRSELDRLRSGKSLPDEEEGESDF